MAQASPQSATPVFEFDAHIRYSEVDHRGLLTLPALINYFQDASTFQSEVIGMGMRWLKERHHGWVLTHWQIVVDRYPALCEPVHVGTFASGFKGVTATRFFYLSDQGGDLAARAKSTWAYMDFAKGRPARAPIRRRSRPTARPSRLRCQPRSGASACPSTSNLATPSPCGAGRSTPTSTSTTASTSRWRSRFSHAKRARTSSASTIAAPRCSAMSCTLPSRKTRSAPSSRSTMPNVRRLQSLSLRNGAPG